MSHNLLQSLARFGVAAAIVITAATCIVPLVAIATGAYASLPSGAGATPRLLLLFLPQAVAVALPIASAAAVFFVCRNLRVTREVCLTVGAFAVATALVTAGLNVSVAPVTNALYRQLAFGDAEGRFVNGRRLNAPGEPGDRFQRLHRRTLPRIGADACGVGDCRVSDGAAAREAIACSGPRGRFSYPARCSPWSRRCRQRGLCG